jgi:amino acid transporter
MSTTTETETKSSAALRKDSLGPLTLAVFVISAVGPVAALLGASPFIFMAVGPGASAAYVVATALFLLISVGYVAMAKRLPTAGGFIVFIANAFDRRMGASAAMLAITAYTALLTSIYAVFGVFLQQLLHDVLGWSVPWWATVLVGLLLVTFASMNRVDVNAKLIASILSIEVLLLLILAVAVFAHGGANGLAVTPFDFGALLGGGGVAVGLLWALGSFLGFEATAVFSEEAREPKKTVPRATYLAVGLMGAFFILMTWAITVGYGTTKVQGAATKDPVGFIYALGDKYVGHVWSVITSFMVVVSFTLILLGFHNIVCRYVFALGRAHFLPPILGRTHARTQAPYAASVAIGTTCAVLLGIFSAFGADPYTAIYPWLYAFGAVGMYLILLLVCMSIPVYFTKNRGSGHWFPKYVAPALSALALIAVLITVLMNYDQFTGPGAPLFVQWSPVLLPVVAVVGYLIGRKRTEEQLSFTVSNIEH